jgi:type I restriction enzyme S subunit
MLPNGWKKVKLGDIATISSGSTPLRSNRAYFENGNMPWVKTMDLTNGKITKTDECITELAAKKCKPYPPGTVLVAMYGGFNQIGRTGLLTFPASINQALAALQFDKDICSEYVLFYLNANVDCWRSCAASSRKDPNITSHDVEKFKIVLPPLEEQKKIAATLSVWDSAIEKMEKLIEAKENAKQFFFYKLVTENSCLWEIKKLSDFLTPGNKTPVLNTSLYRKMIVKLHKKGLEFNTQTREMADTRPFYIRNEGELIIGKQNYFNGSIAMVDKEHDQCICSNAIMSFSIKDIHPLYLYEYISDEEYLKKHSMLANGTGQKELSEKDFLNFEIRVPKRKQQDEIACVLNNCSLEIFLLHAQLENYKKQKQGLMQKLLTGQWRVK